MHECVASLFAFFGQIKEPRGLTSQLLKPKRKDKKIRRETKISISKKVHTCLSTHTNYCSDSTPPPPHLHSCGAVFVGVQRGLEAGNGGGGVLQNAAAPFRGFAFKLGQRHLVWGWLKQWTQCIWLLILAF